jgi:hypothetical protein
MLALLLAVAIPTAAYRAADTATELPASDRRILERYAFRVCGPEGTVDMDPVPDRRGRYFAEPHCNRRGWNGRRYRP